MPSNTDELNQLRRRIRDLEALNTLAISLSSRSTVYETLSLLASWCSHLTHANHAAVLLFTPIHSETVRTLARSSDAIDGGIDHGINVLAAGWVRAHNSALLTDNLHHDLRLEAPSTEQKSFGPLLAVPMFNDTTMIGILNITKQANREPFRREDLETITALAPLGARFIERARVFETLTLDHARLKNSAIGLRNQRWIPSRNPHMLDLAEHIARVAASSATVLISGESGTGKELVAWAIHLQSPRAAEPFVAVNCGAIPPSLADAELFGHERGAFTGADTAQPGKFELADGGTLFLDEISAMPLDLQPRLLRVLESRKFYRVGATDPVNVDIRVIVATNKDLGAEVHHGTFRDDLYHRLNVFPLRLPPLRERREDIPVLAASFLAETSGQKSTFALDALEMLQNMPWPGNVRELRNFVERLSILCGARVITRADLCRAQTSGEESTSREFAALVGALFAHPPEGCHLLEETEKKLIEEALRRTGGNVTGAARLLGISRVSLHRRIDKFHLAMSV